MRISIYKIQQKVSFFVPLLLFAGYFKSSRFDIEQWYLDLTFWLLISILIIQISKYNFTKPSVRVYNPLFFIILPLAFLIMSSILFGDLTSNAYVKIRNFIIILTPTVLVSFWAVKSEADWRYFGNGTLALGLYTSFYIYFYSITAEWGSISYLFSGTLTALGGLVSAYRFLKELRRKWIYFLTFSICSLGVLVSYARGQQVIYVLILLIIFIDYFFSLRNKIQDKVIIIFCLMFLFGFIFAGYSAKVGRGEDVLRRFRPQYILKATHSRITLFEEALKLFYNNPLMPAGIGKYVVEAGTKTFVYPHNIPLEFAAELGLLGVIFYFFINIGALYGYFRFRQKKIIHEHFFIYCFFLLCSFKQGTIYMDKAFWVWTALGLGLLGWRK